jgi:hypothetical protein
MRAAGWGAARGSGHRCCPTRATTRDSRIAVRRGQLLPQGAARSAATLERSPSRTRAGYKPAERVGGAPKDPPETAEVRAYKIKMIYSNSGTKGQVEGAKWVQCFLHPLAHQRLCAAPLAAAQHRPAASQMQRMLATEGDSPTGQLPT